MTPRTPEERERMAGRALHRFGSGFVRVTRHMSLAERMEAQTAYCPVSGCWFWVGTVRAGYGTLSVGYKRRSAHRISYEMYRGPIPEGMVLDHLCRQPSCINPDHLEPVTQAENLGRGIGHGSRAAIKTHCPRGHAYAMSGDRKRCHTCSRVWDRARRARLSSARAAAGYPVLIAPKGEK